MTRSNILFQKRGFAKKLEYQMLLSKSRNPDFVVRHPNETKEKNSANWKADIHKRVQHEEDLRQDVLKLRLERKTGIRRLNQFE